MGDHLQTNMVIRRMATVSPVPLPGCMVLTMVRPLSSPVPEKWSGTDLEISGGAKRQENLRLPGLISPKLDPFVPLIGIPTPMRSLSSPRVQPAFPSRQFRIEI